MPLFINIKYLSPGIWNGNMFQKITINDHFLAYTIQLFSFNSPVEPLGYTDMPAYAKLSLVSTFHVCVSRYS